MLQRDSKIVGYIQLMRPFTLIAPAMGALCGFMLTYGLVKAYYVNILLAAVVLALTNAAGNTINQVFDVDIDRINRASRPIPSGSVSTRQAMIFAMCLYCSATVIAGFVSTWFCYLTMGLISMTLAYSIPPFRVKKRGWVANVWLAISRGPLAITTAWSAFAPLTMTPLITGGIVGLFLVGAVSTKDFQDVAGDAEYGMKTLPVMYGVEGAARRMTPFYIFPFLTIPLFVYFRALPPTTLPLTLLSVYGFFAARFIRRPTNKNRILSWRHMYVMLGLSHFGFGVAYLFSYLLQ